MMVGFRCTGLVLVKDSLLQGNCSDGGWSMGGSIRCRACLVPMGGVVLCKGVCLAAFAVHGTQGCAH